MKHFKYTHLLLQDEFKFASSMIKMLNSFDELEAGQHRFITRFPRVYNQISKFQNTSLDEHEVGYLLFKYGFDTEWIFVHSLNYSPVKVAFLFPAIIAKKTIWRTWGHDVFFPSFREGDTLKNILKKIVLYKYIGRIRQFRYIGIANSCDSVRMNELFGSVPMIRLPYSYLPGRGKMLLDAYNQSTNEKQIFGRPIKVMVGHSGFPSDHQLEILDMLKPYADENMIVSLVLSYGHEEYIASVKSKAISLFGEKIEILDKMIPYEEYLKYLSSVDVAIMDQLHSAALGNVAPLLFFGKKIYLNREGVMYKGFQMENVPFSFTDQIGKIPFDEFCSPVDEKNERFSSLASSTDDNLPIELWADCLHSLK